MTKAWLLLLLALGGCSLAQPESDPVTSLAMACLKAEGEYPAEVAAELRALCDPSAVRGRTPDQQRVDAARVRELTGLHP